MYWLDPIGAGLSLACNYYFSSVNRRGWLLAMMAIFINTIVFYQKSLYGCVLLEGFFIIIALYGWFKWSSKTNLSKREIRFLNVRETLLLIPTLILGIFVTSYVLTLFTSTSPYTEAAILVLCILAQCLLCFKIVECWIFWAIVDILVMVVCFDKGLMFLSAVHFVLLIQAFLSYIRWYKISHAELFYELE